MDNDTLDQVIKETLFARIGNKTMICCLILKNGYEIIGSSSPGKLEEFNEETGKYVAFNNACTNLEDYLKICYNAKNLGAVDIFKVIKEG